MTDIIETMAQPAAKRYAAAITAAAAADERVKVLQDALEASEHLRITAEAQLETVTYPEGFPRVWHAGTDAPPEDVAALMSIYTGNAYRRSHGDLWQRSGSGMTAMRFTWPIDDDGPYIAMPEGYGLDQITKTVDAVSQEYEAIRRELWHHGGVPEGRDAWHRPGIAAAVVGVVTTYRAKVQELEREVRRLEDEIAALTPDEEADS